ncbi:MAG: Mediator of RNA polymerase II transcription subunit 7 [Cirrosporium novae-zelandiae]|nr:MAG: Mediator of RNA polymerase II transcription subunit 7 [Cirrosporium novae-zelandiae]
MDEQQGAVSTSFPDPPPFYQSFTEDNINRLDDIQKSNQIESKDELERWRALRVLDLPSELRLLIPPEPPSSGDYMSFGDHYSLNQAIPSLKDQDVPQLYPSPPSTPSPEFNHAFYLRKLIRSLLLNFLELIGILSTCADQYGPKLEDIRHIFINLHHLINVYRPHQARESLINIMEEELDRKREETKELREIKAKVESTLEGLAAMKASVNELEKNGQIESKKSWSSQEIKEIWDTLDGELMA